MDRNFSFRDAAVFITGGSRGLGLELAREFGKRGARLALCARDVDELARARDDLRGRGIAVETFVADVRDQTQIERAIADAQTRIGAIDVLVNNAGVIQVGPMDALTLDDYQDAMATHFWGPYYAMHALMPGMRARRCGRIVNISSIGGRMSVPHLLPYSASKFALVGLSEGLRSELVRDAVYVTTVSPGLMRTGSPERALFKGRNKLEYAWFSLSDSLPLLTVDVTEAAREIVDACGRGDAELTISLPAKIARMLHGLFPGTLAEVLGVVARMLPQFGGIGSASRTGAQSHSLLSPSLLTVATQHRATTQNEKPV